MEHSRSPAIHTAAAHAAGIDLRYDAIPVRPGDAASFVSRMNAEGFRGLSVTMPHKADVIPALGELTPVAARLGAVNCVVNDDGSLLGDNTDGTGFVIGLRHGDGLDLAGAHVVVLGAGGAARAIVVGCTTAGAARVSIVNRTRDRAEIAARLSPIAEVADAASAAEADLVVNATSLGMAATPGEGRTPIDVDLLPVDTVVVDIVYNPEVTPLLLAAQRRGLRTVGGLPMLAGQAAAQFELWTGVRPSLDVMISGARGSGDKTH